ncbi:MAG: type VII secretion protein EccB [Nocardioides sp.]
MATKRDLVEAHAFSRRRLVTAFVSGAPGGREVEPARPARVIVGGAALSVLLIAGAAIAGVFSNKTPDDWAKPGLFISKETGAAYVITDDERPIVVRPVINITSAKLILGADVEPTIIAQEALEGEIVGGDIGILGAPASPPGVARLIESGWTACTDTDTGLRLDVSTETATRATVATGSVVRSGGRFYLMAQAKPAGSVPPGAQRYLLPRDAGARDNMLTALGLQAGAYATEVSETYLGLFPSGGDLAVDSLGLSRLGDPAPYATAESNLPDGSQIGDIVSYDGGALLLGADHPVDLDPFAQAVYANVAAPDTPRVTQVSGAVNVERGPSTYAEADWPGTLLTPLLGEQCAKLDAGSGSAPRVQLVGDPAGDASAAEVPAGTTSVRVDAGHGAFVYSGDWSDETSGAPFLMDAKGLAYPLVGVGAADQLGYASVRTPVVPDTWIELFRTGVALSQDSALCPPDREAGPSCE